MGFRQSGILAKGIDSSKQITGGLAVTRVRLLHDEMVIQMSGGTQWEK